MKSPTDPMFRCASPNTGHLRGKYCRRVDTGFDPNEQSSFISDEIIILNNETTLLKKMRKGTETVNEETKVEEVLNVEEEKDYESTDGAEGCNMIYETSKFTNADDRKELLKEFIENYWHVKYAKHCMYYIKLVIKR